ncbi:Ff.00g083560.m01.CDS01 [Fusarium sp. VM40]|nr:Ff.00g083560.m01.CDS01 [Fusarium sp. VM40]
MPYGSRVADTESSRTTAHNSEPELPMPLIEKNPPQLGPLPDLSDCNLERSSTLRACIEKPSDDFDVKHTSLCHLSKTDTCQREPIQPRILAQSYTSRPKSSGPLRYGCEPRDGPLCASNHHASAPDKPSSVEDVKQSTDQESLSRSTSITTIQLPPSVLEKPALSEEECLVFATAQPIAKPAPRLQLSDRYSSLDSTLIYSVAAE